MRSATVAAAAAVAAAALAAAALALAAFAALALATFAALALVALAALALAVPSCPTTTTLIRTTASTSTNYQNITLSINRKVNIMNRII